jgi:hypothetical protein
MSDSLNELKGRDALADASTQDSRIYGMSVRAFLVLILVVTLCLMQLANMFLSYLVSGEIVLDIKEPFYSAVTVSLGYYFGQNSKSK